MNPNLREAFQLQAQSCAGLGSVFMARLMQVIPDVLGDAPQLKAFLNGWPGDVSSRGASLPLRVAGGLHALVRSGRARDLAQSYPPSLQGDLQTALRLALHRHEDWLCEWVKSPPQTNEVGRSAVLIAAAKWAGTQTGLPLRLSELGASAGLNLNFDRYTLAPRDLSQPLDGRVVLRPDWSGTWPDSDPVSIVERRGVDLAPLDPVADSEKLLAYIWPDQPERLSRTQVALELAMVFPVPVDKGDAAEWLESRLSFAPKGACHFVYHTVAHQYFPVETQTKIDAVMKAAGNKATAQTPLAWFGMEADGDPNGAALTMRLWPGDLRISLGRAGFHGQWIDWKIERTAVNS